MQSFKSSVRRLGNIELPKWTLHGLNVRVMMLPILLEDELSIPIALVGHQWHKVISTLCYAAPVRKGVAYVTIDHTFVPKGETHRRPGLHVDGIGEDGSTAGYGGGGYAGTDGMLLVSDVIGCRAWHKTMMGQAANDGKCDHLRDQCSDDEAIILQPNTVYWLNPLAVHEAIPMRENTYRAFLRLSMPSNAPWHHGYTNNPLGVKPTGLIHPPRPGMNFRPE